MTSSLLLNIYIIFLFNIAIIFHTLEGFELYSKWFEFFVRSISSMKWIRYLCLLIWVSNKIMKKSFSNYQYFHRSFSFFNSKLEYVQCIHFVWGSVHLYPKNPIIVESYSFLFLLQGISSSSLEQRDTQNCIDQQKRHNKHFSLVRRKNWILFCKCLTQVPYIKKKMNRAIEN